MSKVVIPSIIESSDSDESDEEDVDLLSKIREYQKSHPVKIENAEENVSNKNVFNEKDHEAEFLSTLKVADKCVENVMNNETTNDE